MSYADFVLRKTQLGDADGMEPSFVPDGLFPFQRHLVEWALRRGRAAVWADCGLGKTYVELVWARNVADFTGRPVLILAPLAVAPQTVREGEKFGVACARSTDGKIPHDVVVSNYERLHLFDPDAFGGVVCDESSAIKHFDSARREDVTAFMRKTRFRLLCTATAAPNDHIEIGTSSEALGQLGRTDMLGQFFFNDEKNPEWHGDRWRFRAHAREPFWRWVCSWARAIRKPSDLGFANDGFDLPPLVTRETVVRNDARLPGQLFVRPAVTLAEQREERRATIRPRCERVAALVAHDRPAVAWCHLNDEADLLVSLIPGARQVRGADSDAEKEETFLAFASGQLRVLITKPRIGAFGLNWQHCADMTFFPSHSFEQYYQGVRRCWRFGQARRVTVDVVTTEGERGVLENLKRKALLADEMFGELVRHMSAAMGLEPKTAGARPPEVPSWL